MSSYCASSFFRLQQHLPFTVLKLHNILAMLCRYSSVATAPTVYGIETQLPMFPNLNKLMLQQRLPFTVLKLIVFFNNKFVNRASLQQRLPFTVLKRIRAIYKSIVFLRLQQRLPFTVLKLRSR